MSLTIQVALFQACSMGSAEQIVARSSLEFSFDSTQLADHKDRLHKCIREALLSASNGWPQASPIIKGATKPNQRVLPASVKPQRQFIAAMRWITTINRPLPRSGRFRRSTA